MSCPVSLLHARVYIHATEDLDRVIQALKNVVSGRYVATVARGHHGNVINIVQVRLEDCEALEALKSIVARLDDIEFLIMLSGIEGTRLYAKFDKQYAYRGVLKISHSDDVVYVEVRGRALAVDDMRSFLLSMREALKR
ncbi:exosome protein [Pyrobaculum sp. 3827-6]|uniref:RNA-binding domain-containing protein n=1 Tax=Pyrobaculum sp. 3827-6 TaxID=2983604 RepID=UPI0021D9DD89|nr:RNA-binding domain-containing protein [Pyrobaculum sp. 3827-6]MCU7786483.1 exosome protein [Pyrobaculum sp. 3827-6]